MIFNFKPKKVLVNAILVSLLSPMLLNAELAEASKRTIEEPTKEQIFTAKKMNQLDSNRLVSLANNGQKASDNFDVSKDWKVIDYASDLNTPIENIFVTGKVRPDTGINFASVNFANIGKAHFKAQKIIKLKKNKTYKMNLLFSLKAMGAASGSIDFNGDTKTLTAADEAYETTITPTTDQDYVITMSFETPKYAGMFLMVGFDKNDPDGGIKEEETVEKPTVQVPEAKTSIVEGTGQTGNTIKVTDSTSQVIGESTVNAGGEYTVTTNRPLKYNEVLQVIQVNSFNQESDPVEVTVKDTIAPNKPVIKDIEVSDQMVIGTAEAGSRIEAKSENGQLLGSSTASSEGQVSFKLTEEVRVGDHVSIVAIDEASNVSEVAKVVVVDNTAPVAPDVESLTDLDTKIKGNTKKANCDVTVKIEDQYFYGTSNEAGDFEINLERTFEAGTVVEVYSTDASGNQSPNTTVIVMSDKQTLAPIVNVLGDSDNLLTGSAEKNSAIKVIINNETYRGKTDEKGNFKIKLNKNFVVGTEGKVTATGISGKESEIVTFTVIDNTPPSVPKLNKFTDQDSQLSGLTEPGALVDVYLEETGTNKEYRYQGTSDEAGEFTIDFDRKFAAKSKIKVTATDAAGNVSAIATAKVMSSKELDISLQDLTSQDDEVMGTTSRPNSYYSVKVKNQIFEGYSDSEGNFEISLGRLYEVGTLIEYYAEDDGNKTDITKTKVLPRFPTINNVNIGAIVVTGTVDPDADVEIKVNDNVVGNVTANAAGEYEFELTEALKYGDVLSIIQTKNGVQSRKASLYIGT